MRLTRYQFADTALFTPRADFAADLEAAGFAVPEGPKFTLREGAAVLGVAGFVPLAPGQVGTWACLADLRPRQWVAAARLARRVCAWAAALNAVRIYADPADSDAARRLLAYAGFRPSPDDGGAWKFMPHGPGLEGT